MVLGAAGGGGFLGAGADGPGGFLEGSGVARGVPDEPATSGAGGAYDGRGHEESRRI